MNVNFEKQLADVILAIDYFRAEEKVLSHPEEFEELLVKKRRLEELLGR